MATARASLLPADRFVARHIGPSPDETRTMLQLVSAASLDEFIDSVVPADIRLGRPLALPPGRTEREVLQALRGLAAQNQLYRSYIGMGYYHSFTPQVIQRNIVENPGWYTAYTPYQPEIAQGRLEALLNFQTMVADLTALPITNASLLDEATAAAEAMHLTEAVARPAAGVTPVFMIADGCHPQTIAVVRTRAEARGVQTVVADPIGFEFRPGVIGALLQYPTTDGRIEDYRAVCERAHAVGALVTVATDLLALTLLKPPGERGADIAVGNSQPLGVPRGYRGPRAPHRSANHLTDPHRCVARRGHHPRRPRGPGGRVLAQRGPAVHGRGSRGQGRHRHPRPAATRLVLSHPPGVPPLSVGNRDAALHQAARGAGPVTHHVDDPVGLVHHEAQRDDRDGAALVAGVQPAAPLRPARAGDRLSHAVPAARGHARRDHRLRARLAAAQRGIAGGVHRAARDPRLSPLAG